MVAMHAGLGGIISRGAVLGGLALIQVAVAASAQDSGLWPRAVALAGGELVMYEPQLESFEGDRVTARAAIAWRGAGEPFHQFGAVWMTSRVATDRETRRVDLTGVTVERLRLPRSTAGSEQDLARLLTWQIQTGSLPLSLDMLLAGLDAIGPEAAATRGLKHDPPRIIVAREPAVLVTIDGEPRLKPIENSPLSRVANTPFHIAYYPAGPAFYLKGGPAWYAAEAIDGEWERTDRVPRLVAEWGRAIERDDAAWRGDARESPAGGTDGSLRIIVATDSAELIAFDGEPRWGPVEGTNLLYAVNARADVFRDIDTREIFALISGRWYGAGGLDGPWRYVPGGELPADFALIPPGSATSHVLAHVPGTREARDAVLDTMIPQTAAIDRSKATLRVTFDGAPRFEPIEGGAMSYAVNSPFDVVRVEGSYFACHEAVWYEASRPEGPYAVCVSVPAVIYTMPAASPLHHVRFAHVYDSTPEVAYAGYTPGYVGSLVEGEAVVYGTGHAYDAWKGGDYYARPRTFGFGVRLEPYSGEWGFRAGAGGGAPWVRGGGGADAAGWWGPGGYREFEFAPGEDAAPERDLALAAADGELLGGLPFAGVNLYTLLGEGLVETGAMVAAGGALPGADPAPAEVIAIAMGGFGAGAGAAGAAMANDIYIDAQGNVARRTAGGGASREGDEWIEYLKSIQRPGASGLTPNSQWRITIAGPPRTKVTRRRGSGLGYYGGSGYYSGARASRYRRLTGRWPSRYYRRGYYRY